MAAAIANIFFVKNNIDATASSAGVFALDGLPASSNALVVMADMGLEIGGHKAVRFTENHTEAHIIITMTSAHKIKLLEDYGRAADKIFTISELCGGQDITDPFGGDKPTYFSCAEQIKNCIENISWRSLL